MLLGLSPVATVGVVHALRCEHTVHYVCRCMLTHSSASVAALHFCAFHHVRMVVVHSLLSANAFSTWAETAVKSGDESLVLGLSPVATVGAVHALCWIAQFYGHAAHEKRSPALMDNLFQALLAAPLFVLLKLVSFAQIRSLHCFCSTLWCSAASVAQYLEHAVLG